MNKMLKLAVNIVLTAMCAVTIGFLGYWLTYQYKFFIEKTFHDVQKEVYTYIDYYLNFIVTT